jgi:hypothetical protein
VHIPAWLVSDGMGVDKIGAFYTDPVKNACDRHSFDKAFTLRSMSIDESLSWRARRWARFLGRLAIGTARRFTAPLPTRIPTRDAPSRERAAAELSLHQR